MQNSQNLKHISNPIHGNRILDCSLCNAGAIHNEKLNCLEVLGSEKHFSPPARSAGTNDCVSRVCVIMGWEWDGIGIGMAIPGGAACVAGIGDPDPKT